MEIYDVVMKLVGQIEPVGATHIDGERFENLKQLTDLTNQLVTAIDDIGYRLKDRPEHSIKQAAEHCQKFLDKTLGIAD